MGIEIDKWSQRIIALAIFIIVLVVLFQTVFRNKDVVVAGTINGLHNQKEKIIETKKEIENYKTNISDGIKHFNVQLENHNISDQEKIDDEKQRDLLLRTQEQLESLTTKLNLTQFYGKDYKRIEDTIKAVGLQIANMLNDKQHIKSFINFNLGIAKAFREKDSVNNYLANKPPIVKTNTIIQTEYKNNPDSNASLAKYRNEAGILANIHKVDSCYIYRKKCSLDSIDLFNKTQQPLDLENILISIKDSKVYSEKDKINFELKKGIQEINISFLPKFRKNVLNKPECDLGISLLVEGKNGESPQYYKIKDGAPIEITYKTKQDLTEGFYNVMFFLPDYNNAAPQYKAPEKSFNIQKITMGKKINYVIKK